jgi:Xaa-Pro aminopeptidase
MSSTLRPVYLRDIPLPEFGLPDDEPVVPASVYAARVTAAEQRATAHGLDVMIVWGDREHCGNIAYLCALDPRFEEAMLILKPGRTPRLCVGNEGWGYATLSPLPHERILFQDLSLLGQPRDNSPTLEQLLTDAGVAKGSRVGVAGWKYKEDSREMVRRSWIEVPAYLVDALRAMTGDPALVENVTDLFMNARDGLRTVNEAEQLAAFEYAGVLASTAVNNVITSFKIGQTEYQAMELMKLNGFPTNCHPMLTAGPRATVGHASPSTRPIERGDFLTAALGLWGTLSSRCGFVVADAAELPEAIRDYADKLVVPYFRAASEWLEALHIGVTGGELFDIVHRHVGDAFFGVHLNPGHQVHLDEWLNSPIYAGSNIALKSGMALQLDIIPATGTPYQTTNIEDGMCLADAQLREEIAAKFPALYARTQARRQFMNNELGIVLSPDVLPFSNAPAYLAPFLLSPSQVLTSVPG